MTFEPEGNGAKGTLIGRVEAGGFFKLAEVLVKKRPERQFDTNLEALKLLLEGQRG